MKKLGQLNCTINAVSLGIKVTVEICIECGGVITPKNISNIYLKCKCEKRNHASIRS